MAKVTGLFTYPVKSCRGIEVREGRLTERGLQHDREWMIVDAQDRFITQREYPCLALIEPTVDAAALVLRAPDRNPLSVPLGSPGDRRTVTVWRHTGPAFDQGEEAAQWLSSFIGSEVRLVRFDPATRRLCNPEFAGDSGAHVAFSDGYPLLVIGEASLADLNRRLEEQGRGALPMNRFRPNVVVSGMEAYEEDYVDTFHVGPVRVKLVKPCARCVITTTDQYTARRGVEPLRTLSTYRMDVRFDGITFGQNAIIAGGVGQRLRIGDALDIEWRL